jgi:hypothetical protein
MTALLDVIDLQQMRDVVLAAEAGREFPIAASRRR